MAEDKRNSRSVSAGYGAAVFGSEAYDPAWFLPEQPEEFPEVRPQSVPETQPQPQSRPAPRRKTRRKAKTGLRVQESEDARSGEQGIPVVSLVLVGLVLAAAVMILMANIRLMTIRSETRALQRSVTQLQQQSQRLDVAYAAAFDLNQVRAYAQEELGMREPAAGQMHRLDLGTGDRALVLTPSQTTGEKTVLRLAGLWQSLLAYFQ